MTRDSYIATVLCMAMAVGVGILAGMKTAHAQSQPHRTVTWTMRAESTFGRVDVVDTAGTCIYLASYGVTAVSKAALPGGTGCE